MRFICSPMVVSSQTTYNVITKLKQYFNHLYELSSSDGYPRQLKRDDSSLLLMTEEELRRIKSSYNTYVPEVVSGKIDCKRRASKNSPSHCHVMNLIEHVMDINDALIFCHQVTLLKKACALSMSKSSP